MKLGWTEWWLMNNPMRPLMHKFFEVRNLLRMGGTRPNAKVLDIGCGNGGGIALLFDSFKVGGADGFDLDPRMVKRAKTRLGRRPESIGLWTGNVGRIPVADHYYDAVFDFGVLHHVVDWQTALMEIHRVLKPGGRFYIEEITRRFIVHPLWRRLLDHPQENRFERQDLVAALEGAGFQIHDSRQFGGLFIWCIADKPAA